MNVSLMVHSEAEQTAFIQGNLDWEVVRLFPCHIDDTHEIIDILNIVDVLSASNRKISYMFLFSYIDNLFLSVIILNTKWNLFIFII
jgi:hypothetical protein